jgi:hypothetical protein
MITRQNGRGDNNQRASTRGSTKGNGQRGAEQLSIHIFLTAEAYGRVRKFAEYAAIEGLI